MAFQSLRNARNCKILHKSSYSFAYIKKAALFQEQPSTYILTDL